MRSAPLPLTIALLLAGLAAGAHGQVQKPQLPAQPASLLPGALPALAPNASRSTMLYADRIDVRPAPRDLPAGMSAHSSPVAPVSTVLPAGVTGTGMAEHIQYQAPSGALAPGQLVPLLVAWHGFGSSANSVSLQTALDEFCAAHGWAYLSVTGIDDKLFGTPPTQTNVEAAIAWMRARFPIDPDRIHMVGFSMGAGAVANFAARHRDPDGLMIAGLGLVAGSFDWMQTWLLEPAVQPWMHNPWNFGAAPVFAPWNYQRSSTLHFDPFSYPPTPGALAGASSMAVNLHATPTYLTWDLGDSITYLPAQSGVLASQLLGAGGLLVQRPVTGTVHPQTGAPATHSWAVLDEAELFAFLAGVTAQRRPANFRALVDRDSVVSWTAVRQRGFGQFSWVAGERDAGLGRVLDLTNVEQLTIAGASAELPLPPRWIANTADGQTSRLRWASTSGYLVTGPGGGLSPGQDSAPFDGALLHDLPAWGAIDVTLVPVAWGAALDLLPDPAPPGGAVTLSFDGPTGASVAWLVLSTATTQLPLPSGQPLLVAPSLLLPLGLDGAGNVSFAGTVPADPALSGLRLYLQALVRTDALRASNLVRFDVL